MNDKKIKEAMKQYIETQADNISSESEEKHDLTSLDEKVYAMLGTNQNKHKTAAVWFKDRGQWIDNSATPSPGMIIFFDWNNKGSSGPQDGLSDHVGIVERVEDGIIYTIEGNSGDSCRENHYAVGHYEILGYGVPAH